MSSTVLSKKQSVQLTSKIKKNLNSSSSLIKKAVEGKVWVALGYSGFAQWLTEAVGISRARGYQLLNIANLEDDLKTRVPLPEYFTVSDLNTRMVIRDGREQFINRISEESGTDENANALIVEKALSSIRGTIPGSEREKIEADADLFAENFFRQFAETVEDLPNAEDVDPGYEDAILAELKTALVKVDSALSQYARIAKGKVA